MIGTNYERRETGHINNLYNTTFWTMIQKGGMTNTDAERELKVSTSSLNFQSYSLFNIAPQW
jgi:Uncharacterized conserved protein